MEVVQSKFLRWLLCVALVVSVSCGSKEEPVLSPLDGGPLPVLGPCGPVPEEGDYKKADVRGIVFPPGAVIRKTRPNGPATNVRGYIPITPVKARQFYEAHKGLEILQIEDETVESEILVSDGAFRTFAKFQAVCESASKIVAITAPEVNGEKVPTPAGTGTPPP